MTEAMQGVLIGGLLAGGFTITSVVITAIMSYKAEVRKQKSEQHIQKLEALFVKLVEFYEKLSNSKDSDAKDSDVKDSDVKDSDVKDSDVKDSDVKDSDAKDSDAKDSDAKDSDAKDSDAKDSDAKDPNALMNEYKKLSAELFVWGTAHTVRLTAELQKLLELVDENNPITIADNVLIAESQLNCLCCLVLLICQVKYDYIGEKTCPKYWYKIKYSANSLKFWNLLLCSNKIAFRLHLHWFMFIKIA